ILYERTSYTFQMIQDYFRGREQVLFTFMELGSMEAIKELVKLNLGVSILAPLDRAPGDRREVTRRAAAGAEKAAAQMGPPALERPAAESAGGDVCRPLQVGH
nr:hypothetical protein [Verrucomicrobiota bacterium]